MATDATRTEGSLSGGALRSLSRQAWRRPWLKALAELVPPVSAFLVVYVAALVALLVAAFWSVDEFTSEIVRTWSLDNFRLLWEDPTYRRVTLRTVGIAAAVTVTCIVLAVPYALFVVRVASPRLRVLLLVATVLPLWVSYLVRVYSWRLILNPDGALNWALAGLGLPEQRILYTNWAMWVVYTYIWFPFMVLPVVASLERIPGSYLEASSDLGARAWTTLRRVVLPLAVPGIAAGSIFTFSLTLGDYIAPTLVGGPSSQLIGNVIFANVGVANNVPFAAAFATVPLAIMAVYLVVMKRLGAFENL
ncbi:MAG TPA: ABC transporter permease [Gaiellaceae bacterium]|nr:ABC transporter permease [Gaiellaceae bacterium]